MSKKVIKIFVEFIYYNGESIDEVVVGGMGILLCRGAFAATNWLVVTSAPAVKTFDALESIKMSEMSLLLLCGVFC